MPSPGEYLLDTTVLLHLIRNNKTGQYVRQSFNLHEELAHCAICIVTVGEIVAFSRKLSWGASRIDEMHDLLSKLGTISIDSDDVIEAYAEADFLSHRNKPSSIVMGKNDLWIAAVARVTGFVLLTCDGDFEHLITNGFLRGERVPSNIT